MKNTSRARLACLALALPLALGACRDDKDTAAQTTAPAADSTAPAPAKHVVQAPVAPPPAPPPVCVDCGTVTDVRSYQTKGTGSGVGAAVGAVAGGLLGHQIGGGSGKTIATVAGVVGGGLAGNEIEKRRNATTQWEVTVRLDNGTTTTLQYAQAPGLTVGQKVRVINGQASPL